MRHRRHLAVALLASLVAACGTGGAGTTTSSAEPPPSTEPPGVTTTTAPTTTTSTTAPAPTGAASGDLEECLLGTWQLDSQAFLDEVFSAFPVEGGGSPEHLEGTYTVTFGGAGSLTTTRSGWTWGMSMPEGSMRFRFDGTDTGTYSLDGDRLEVEVGITGTEVTLSMEAGGESMALPAGSVPVPEGMETVAGVGTVACEGDTLTLASEEGITSTFRRTG